MNPAAAEITRISHRLVLVSTTAFQTSLGRMRWLERSNLRVAVAVAYAYLVASGVPAKLDQQRVAALATELKKESSTARSVAGVLKSWAV